MPYLKLKLLTSLTRTITLVILLLGRSPECFNTFINDSKRYQRSTGETDNKLYDILLKIRNARSIFAGGDENNNWIRRSKDSKTRFYRLKDLNKSLP